MKLFFFLNILIGAFLLFLIQPMMAKLILPYVGGAPAVWIVTMLFFQLLLLGGYGYAALTSAYMTPRTQSVLHLAIYVLAAALFLPLQLHMATGELSESPEQWVLITLLLTIGLPYFLLSSNSTLTQRWYHHCYGTSPYFLFSISNVGSVLGLLGYPLLVEWLFPLQQQMFLWGTSFLLIVALVGALALTVGMHRQSSQPKSETLGKNLPFRQAMLVVFLGFIPSSLFLGTTLLVTTDIASFPLLWVIPLTLYLLSFIVVFSSRGSAWALMAQKLHPIAFFFLLMLHSFVGADSAFYAVQIAAYFVGLFIIALSCHGRAAMEKPQPQYLTAFFFWLSVGGALGGLFNTVAPYLFDGIFEYVIVVCLSLLALPARHLTKENPYTIQSPKRAMVAAGGIVVVAAGMWFHMSSSTPENVLFSGRNFFGVSKVTAGESVINYQHGTTLHGLQPIDAEHRLKPTSYYGHVNNLIERLPDSFYQRPFGVLGLGAGTAACFAHPGQRLDFFEIDPMVIAIARNPDYFTYVRDCPGDIQIIQGDGRLALGEQPDQKYNLLVMDAFTSDAIPVHLVTKEAVGTYMDKLHPTEGVLAFNISNRHLDLKYVMARLAEAYGWRAYYKFYHEDPDDPYDANAIWMIMLPDGSPWHDVMLDTEAGLLEAPEGTPLWTDDYSHILPLIKW